MHAVAELVLGPLLRYVGESEATIWVETDASCEVEVLDHRARTWRVGEHHYALVQLSGLEPGRVYPYELRLDGRMVWPRPASALPPSAIRTLHRGRALRIAFGSCRVSVPHEPPYTLSKDADERGRGSDALLGLVERMLDQPVSEWPDLVLLLGDQVYADEVSPGAREFIRARRDTDVPPGEEVADFEEYVRLYWDAWRTPEIRWLLSTVSSAMVWDDHDVHDDWNTSQAWVEDMRERPWWEERIAGAYMSYWVYQHLGNLSPGALAEDELFARVLGTDGDAGPVLHDFAMRAERRSAGARWSYHRDLGASRLVVLDSRAGRVLEEGGRSMVDEAEWRWIEGCATGGVDHLLLATTVPFLLAPGMHHLEAWNERVCRGAWGRAAARIGERMRQALDLEHWAAFEHSFRRLTNLVESVGAGRRGDAPASIVALSGDVHHAYLAEVAFRREAGVRSAVYQATCSPLRNPLDSRERRLMRFAASRAAHVLAHGLARLAGLEDPTIRWRLTGRPTFDNQLALLDLDGPRARLRIQRAEATEGEPPRLEVAMDRRLA
jgi:hypothetical protein